MLIGFVDATDWHTSKIVYKYINICAFDLHAYACAQRMLANEWVKPDLFVFHRWHMKKRASLTDDANQYLKIFISYFLLQCSAVSMAFYKSAVCSMGCNKWVSPFYCHIRSYFITHYLFVYMYEGMCVWVCLHVYFDIQRRQHGLMNLQWLGHWCVTSAIIKYLCSITKTKIV